MDYKDSKISRNWKWQEISQLKGFRLASVLLTVGLLILTAITVFAAAPVITSTPVTQTVVNEAYSYQVTASGSPTYTLTLKPLGMMINESTGLITWTPTMTGEFDVSVVAQNVDGSDTQDYTLTVGSVPEITSSPVTSGEVGVSYSYTVNASGYPAPTFALTTKPSGMMINETTGEIAWTPSAPGSYSVTVRATNFAGLDTQSFTIDVSSVCPSGIVSYWQLNETSGLLFSDYIGSNDATFSGAGSPGYATGKVNGAVDFNGINHRLATASTSNPTAGLTVMAWINPEDLTAPDLGILSKKDAFVFDIESEGDKVSFVVIDGGGFQEFEPDVPENVVQANEWTFVTATYDGATQQIHIYINGTEIGSTSTTISVLGNSSEPYSIGLDSHFGTDRYFDGRIDEVAVFNRALSTSEIQLQYSRTLAGEGYCDAALSVPDIVSMPDTQMTIGEDYTYDVDAAGNPGITYSILSTHHPSGMNIDSKTGLITWTPTAPGSYPVRVRATNSEGFDQQNFAIQVDAIAPQIVSGPLTSAVVGLEYTYDVNATGVPTPTYALTQKPSGMTINSTTGVISWTPTATGNVNVTVTATNAGGTDTQSFTISAQAANAICPANMEAYWRLDEVSGALFADSYGARDA
ncbi:MAG: hypothetical protein GY805_18965, partial [Chloroflexi bacterium]|nr:hypothetical protein [Chloroflexota bacterium]